MIKPFAKMFHLGHHIIEDLFEGEVEVTEKVDGSQFSFGRIKGELVVRSKGKVQEVDAPDKMFIEAIEYVKSIYDKLIPDVVYHCEYLRVPSHNTLKYDRIPKNHLALFGVRDHFSDILIDDHRILCNHAEALDIDVVPLIYSGKTTAEDVIKMIDQKSYLGGPKMEGVVVKRYEPYEFQGMVIPCKAGKFVSEAFKEVHNRDWKKIHTGKGKWQDFIEGYLTEARWNKAIQYLRDNGELAEEPKDIGPLIKRIQQDIVEEEKEKIMEVLWSIHNEDVKRKAIQGFPQWYKERLALGESNG